MSTGFWMVLLLGVLIGFVGRSIVVFVVGPLIRATRKHWVA